MLLPILLGTMLLSSNDAQKTLDAALAEYKKAASFEFTYQLSEYNLITKTGKKRSIHELKYDVLMLRSGPWIARDKGSKTRFPAWMWGLAGQYGSYVIDGNGRKTPMTQMSLAVDSYVVGEAKRLLNWKEDTSNARFGKLTKWAGTDVREIVVGPPGQTSVFVSKASHRIVGMRAAPNDRNDGIVQVSDCIFSNQRINKATRKDFDKWVASANATVKSER